MPSPSNLQFPQTNGFQIKLSKEDIGDDPLYQCLSGWRLWKWVVGEVRGRESNEGRLMFFVTRGYLKNTYKTRIWPVTKLPKARCPHPRGTRKGNMSIDSGNVCPLVPIIHSRFKIPEKFRSEFRFRGIFRDFWFRSCRNHFFRYRFLPDFFDIDVT
jgi:hypothetical protein